MGGLAEQAAWVADRTGYCRIYRARISPAACEKYKGTWRPEPHPCRGCQGLEVEMAYSIGTCKDCGKTEIKIQAHGLCMACYTRRRRSGDLVTNPKHVERAKRGAATRKANAAVKAEASAVPAHSPVKNEPAQGEQTSDQVKIVGLLQLSEQAYQDQRVRLALADDVVIGQLAELAREDFRDLTGQVKWLIRREYQARRAES